MFWYDNCIMYWIEFEDSRSDIQTKIPVQKLPEARSLGIILGYQLENLRTMNPNLKQTAGKWRIDEFSWNLVLW